MVMEFTFEMRLNPFRIPYVLMQFGSHTSCEENTRENEINDRKNFQRFSCKMDNRIWSMLHSFDPNIRSMLLLNMNCCSVSAVVQIELNSISHEKRNLIVKEKKGKKNSNPIYFKQKAAL